MRIIEQIYEKDSFGNAWQRGLLAVLRNDNHITFGDSIEPKKAMEIGLNIELVGDALKEALEYKLHPQFPTKELHKQAYEIAKKIVKAHDKGGELVVHHPACL